MAIVPLRIAAYYCVHPMNDSRIPSAASPASAKKRAPLFTWTPGGPVGAVLKLFSSMRLGIVLLILLFLYSSIGSAGAPLGPGALRPWFILNPDAWIHIRTMRGLEMTEFEWFHWWPFKLLIALICVNLVVATLRRIPLDVLHLGVWMIHAGIIILCLGSVWYFSTKVEGDAPVARRKLVITVPGVAPASMLASPGNRSVLQSDEGVYRVQVASIDPQWELLSGPDEGKRAYSVTLSVTTPTQQFMRQVIANHPEYTEDIVRTDDPQQPMKRAKKINPDGEALVDKSIAITMDYQPQEHFYLMDSSAIYVRKRGERAWSQRVVEGLPRFNAYVGDRDEVWLPENYTLDPDALDIAAAPGERGDALGERELHISGYLPYAQMQKRRQPGGDAVDPFIDIRLQAGGGAVEDRRLEAFNPASNSMGDGRLVFRWFDSDGQIDAYAQRKPAMLHIAVPGEGEEGGAAVEFDAPITTFSRLDPDAPFNEIEGTEYAWRVQTVQDDLPISGVTVSLAFVEVRKGDDVTLRWVFEDESMTRDVTEESAMAGHDIGEDRYDRGIEIKYVPGQYLPPITIAAGPDDRTLRLLLAIEPGEVRREPITIGTPIEISQGIEFTAVRYAARSVAHVRPYIVPPQQRDSDAMQMRVASMIQVNVPGATDEQPVWLEYHEYPFETAGDALVRFPYEPTIVPLADGSAVELLFSQARMKLPTPVVLDDFVVTSHIGGFTGPTSTIRNWTSMVRFADAGTTIAGDDWSAPLAVSVNEPVEHEGFWFFQASWDPPIRNSEFQSAGLNYTVLGVGNRNGVLVQLLGCTVAVIGMIYAFYIKPILKRRRQQAVYADVSKKSVVVESASISIVESNGFVREETSVTIATRTEDRR